MKHECHVEVWSLGRQQLEVSFSYASFSLDTGLILHLSRCIIRLHRMLDMQTIVTDDRGVSLSVTRSNWVAARAVCAGSFGAAFAESFWPLVC